jgi:hypothetical protein
MPSRSHLLLIVLVLLPVTAAAQDPVQEVRDCLKRNIPKKSSEQTVHFTAIDRIGGQREFRAKMLGMKLADGTRRAKLCINQPPEMRGSEMLSMETPDGAPDSFLFTPELRKVKRITGEGVGGSVFGTDFTYEDLQRWQQLSYIDKKTCVVIKSESFENGDRLRKLLTAKTDEMLEENGIFAPAEVVMKDVRDETRTIVVVEDLEVDGNLGERSFEVSALGKHCK